MVCIAVIETEIQYENHWIDISSFYSSSTVNQVKLKESQLLLWLLIVVMTIYRI